MFLAEYTHIFPLFTVDIMDILAAFELSGLNMSICL